MKQPSNLKTKFEGSSKEVLKMVKVNLSEKETMKNLTKNSNKEESKMMKRKLNKELYSSNTSLVAFFHHHRSVRRPDGQPFGTTIIHDFIPGTIFDVIELVSNIDLHKLFNKPIVKINNLKHASNINKDHLLQDDIQLYIRAGFSTKDSISSSYTDSIRYAINYIDVDIEFKINNVKHKLDKYSEETLLEVSKVISSAIDKLFPHTKFYVYPTYQGYRVALFYSPTLVSYEEFKYLKRFAFKPILEAITKELQNITDIVEDILKVNNLYVYADKGNSMEVLRLPLLKYNPIFNEHRLYATYMHNGEYFINLKEWFKQTPAKDISKAKYSVSTLMEETKMLRTSRPSKAKLNQPLQIDTKFKEIKDKLEPILSEIFELSKAFVIFLEDYKIQYYLSSYENRKMNDILPMIILSYIILGKSYSDLLSTVKSLNIRKESFAGWFKKFTEDEDIAGLLVDGKINETLIKQNIKMVLEWLLHIENLIPEISKDTDLIKLRAKVYKALSVSFDKGSIVEKVLVKSIMKQFEAKNLFGIDEPISNVIKEFRTKMYEDIYKFITLDESKNLAYVVATTGIGKTSTTLQVIDKILDEEPNTLVVYLSPFRAINKQVKEKLSHERFKVLTIQSLIEKAYRLVKEDIFPLLTESHLTITKSIFKEFGLDLRKLLPSSIDHTAYNRIIFILDEVHELKNLYKMEFNKQNTPDLLKIKALLYKELLDMITSSAIDGKLPILFNKDKLITLTATPPIETLLYPKFKYILPRQYRTCEIKFHRDFYKVKANLEELPTYLKDIETDKPRKVLLYVNNKKTQAKLVTLLKKYFKDSYTIISLDSSNPSLETRLENIEHNENVIIVTTAVIRAGFDSDIDYIIFYGFPQDRDELLQVVGRNRNLKLKTHFVVAGDIPGRQIPLNMFTKYMKTIVEYLDIYYTVRDKEIPKLSELLDNRQELRKLTNEANSNKVYPKQRDIESLVSVFENSITPYSYYQIAIVPSIPVTKLKKYKLDKNTHLWDLAYDLIPLDIRNKYFTKPDILLKDFVYNDPKVKKVKETTRFRKYYQSIGNVSYEMLLDRFTLTLTLNSKIDYRPQLISKLTKSILTDIQFDPYSNMYYFTNDSGFMLIPIDYNKETIKLAEDKQIIDIIGFRYYKEKTYFNKGGGIVPQDRAKIVYNDELIIVAKSGKRIYFVYKNLEVLEKLFIDKTTAKESVQSILNEMRENGGENNSVKFTFFGKPKIHKSGKLVNTVSDLLSSRDFKLTLLAILKDLNLKLGIDNIGIDELVYIFSNLAKDSKLFNRYYDTIYWFIFDILGTDINILYNASRSYAYYRRVN